MGRKVLITGAGSGLGRGLALALAGRGHAVTAGVLTEHEAEDLGHEAPGIDTIVLDITRPEDRQQLADRDVDVLVNSAGIGQAGPLRVVPEDRVRRVFEVNVFGTLAVTRIVAERMLARSAGRILIVSSVAGVVAGPFTGPYSMTKHALQAMGQCLRAELAPAGIDVALVNPGPFATGFNDRMIADSAAVLERQEARAEELDFLAVATDRITGHQLDPAEAVEAIVALVEAERTEPINFVPPDILRRMGLDHPA
jgi:NAD(P)-dependent dehydrogenase (short-subunit alcohol dehydrogenase family)